MPGPLPESRPAHGLARVPNSLCTPGGTGPMSSFVDFRNVWLAYNDELLAQGQFAVEDISLQVTEGE
ncbi:MAG: ABC transporter ATP-binding protein, partial [Rubrivivax sp.]